MLKLSHCSIGGKENDDSGCTCDNESSTFLFFEQPERINKEKITIVRIFVIFVWGGGKVYVGRWCKTIFFISNVQENLLFYSFDVVFFWGIPHFPVEWHTINIKAMVVLVGDEYISNASSNFGKGRELMRSVFASRGSVWVAKKDEFCWKCSRQKEG